MTVLESQHQNLLVEDWDTPWSRETFDRRFISDVPYSKLSAAFYQLHVDECVAAIGHVNTGEGFFVALDRLQEWF